MVSRIERYITLGGLSLFYAYAGFDIFWKKKTYNTEYHKSIKEKAEFLINGKEGVKYVDVPYKNHLVFLGLDGRNELDLINGIINELKIDHLFMEYSHD
jgi:hypothetical protein